LWTCKVFSFSFLVLFSSFFFVCVCVYWVCEQVCACARWVTHNTNTHSTCTISYKSLTPSQNALCVFFFFFSLSLSLSKRKVKKKERKKKKEKTPISLGIYGTWITEVSPFTLPLTKGPSCVYGGFFFLYYSRNTRDLGKAKCWTNITPPPPHSHTCLREY
jgi:hypothetical protein